MERDIRWHQRFDNFEKALALLKEAFEKDVAAMSDLEKEGVVQRFEYTFELAWKTLKDYLIFNGVSFDQITPKSVIKQAFAAKIITDGQIWIDMLEERNLMSHTYSNESFESVFDNIANRYLAVLEQTYKWLKKQK